MCEGGDWGFLWLCLGYLKVIVTEIEMEMFRARESSRGSGDTLPGRKREGFGGWDCKLIQSDTDTHTCKPNHPPSPPEDSPNPPTIRSTLYHHLISQFAIAHPSLSCHALPLMPCPPSHAMPSLPCHALPRHTTPPPSALHPPHPSRLDHPAVPIHKVTIIHPVAPSTPSSFFRTVTPIPEYCSGKGLP